MNCQANFPMKPRSLCASKNQLPVQAIDEPFMTKSNRIYCIESEEAATTDQVLEKLVKKRLKLKDQIVGMRLRIERRMWGR